MDSGTFRVARFELKERWRNRGGTSIWLGTQCSESSFTREVVVKVVPLMDDDFGDEWSTRATRLVHLAHPNHVGLVDAGQCSVGRYWAMERIDGHDLKAHLMTARGNRVPPLAAFFIACEMAKGLAALHASKTEPVHGAIRPAHVMISQTGQVQLIDLVGPSLRSRFAPGDESTFVAPEQVLGGKCDSRSDVYSLALVLVELLLGSEMLAVHQPSRSSRERILGALRAVHLPSQLTELMGDALSFLPQEREARAADFVATLRPWLAQAEYDAGKLAAYLLLASSPDRALKMRKLISKIAA